MGCGNDVTLKENKLENLDALNSSSNTSYKKLGTLKKGSPSQVTVDGKTYIVSIYSSKSALDFISPLPLGHNYPSHLRGEFRAIKLFLRP